MRFDTYVFSSAGGREYNEDAAGVQEQDGGLLCVLADGLGGHSHGELASETVLRTFFEAKAPGAGEDGGEWLAARMEAANKNVLALQAAKGFVTKSTAVALLLREDGADWANVGDSRLYFLRGDELCAVTEDHSLAYRKYKAGEIARRDLPTDPDQSSLLRALGNPERHSPALSRAGAPPGSGDAFLLCSDGVWEYVRDGEVLIDYLKSETAEDWAKRLLLRVISRAGAGNDNLSLITVIVKGGTGHET